MKTLTSKLLNEKLKKGWTAKEFAEHLKCTEEEFWDAMAKTFYGNAYKNMCAQLKKNEKNRSRAIKKVYSRLEKMDTSKYLEEYEDAQADDTAVNVPPEEMTEPETLETLTNKKIELHQSMNELLKKRDEYQISKTNFEAQLKLANEELSELQKRVELCKTSITSIEDSMEAEEKKAEQNEVSIRFYESKLTEINAKIESLRKVTILVYNSGEVAISCDSDTTTPIWAEEFDTLIKNDTLECLTIKQLKALAQVICLARELIAQNRQYEIVFENQLSEDFFKEVIN